jgi:hypothetical protein
MTNLEAEVMRLHIRLDVLIQYLATVKPASSGQPILGPTVMGEFAESTNRLLSNHGLPELLEGTAYATDLTLGKMGKP